MLQSTGVKALGLFELVSNPLQSNGGFVSLEEAKEEEGKREKPQGAE